jgi:ABC-2 type transport system permease protein
MDDIAFTWRFLLLLYPIFTMLLFSIGIGLILSALFIFFRDIDYLWGVFLQLLMYGSAIFYKIDSFPSNMQMVFACNPVYRHIAYFREIVLGGAVPSWETHLVLAGFAVIALLVGMFMYKRYNTKFLYYV